MTAPNADYADAIEQAERNVKHGWGGNGLRISEALVASQADLEEMNDRMARACDVLNAADKCFEGWSYGDVFSRVEKMRVMIRAFLAEREEQP